MTELAEVVAEAGVGLVGDRFHGTRHRHVTVQSTEALAEAADRLGAPVAAAATRRNVTVTGVEVPSRPGERLALGQVQLEVVRIAAPCPVMETSVGPGARAALHACGGSVCRILVGGTIRVGDPVS